LSGDLSFYRYAAIVKNLRGVVYWRGGYEDRFNWLLSRFKYRSLGVPPSLSDVMPQRRTLVRLAYPALAVREAAKLFSKAMPFEAAETLCLASAYVSPIMAVGNIQDFRPAIIRTVRTSIEPDDKKWRLHMRIADYTTLDFYAWSTETALEAIRKGRLRQALEERAGRAADDEKRYWRLKPGEGRAFLTYLDPLKIVCEAGLIDEFKKLGEDAASVLGMIAAIVV